MQLVDLSQAIEPGMPLFSPTAPQPRIEAWQTHAASVNSGKYEGCTCEMAEVSFVTSLGTYLDSPFHFDPSGIAIEKISLDRLVLPGLRVDCTNVEPRQPIEPSAFDGLDVAGKAVLFHTGWDRFWDSPEYFEYPFLTEETALALREGGAGLAGVDFLVIDDTTDPRRPVHVTLLKADILIVENLTNLAALPEQNFIFHAAPAKVAGAAAFPIRAYATV